MANDFISSTALPALEDSFGVSNYITGLRSFICVCQIPMTIAVQSDWGSGKTSIMKLVIGAAFKPV